MLTRVLLVSCLLVAGAALWLARGGVHTPEITPAPVAPIAAAPVAPPPVFGAVVPHSPPAAAVPPAVEQLAKSLNSKLDTRSDAFRERLDEVIPGRLYADAARCYKGGLLRDQKVKLEFRLRIADGEVSVADTRVLSSNLGDANLERCIGDQVKHAHWHDDTMPDWESSEELLIRIRGFSKYAQQDRDEEPASPL